MSKNLVSFSIKPGLLLLLWLISGTTLADDPPVNVVNPMIGTDDHGHTFPGAALPGGLVQLGPDTDIKGWDWCSGYHYSDSSIMGFSHLHRSGMGAGDWGDILLMPTTGKLKIVPGSKENPSEGYRSRFSHTEEVASPGYYSVNLKDYGIRAELTVSERVGFHRYTFPKSDVSHILIDLNHGIGDVCTDAQIRIVNNSEIEGYRASRGFIRNQHVYFCARFNKPFKTFGTWDKNSIMTGSAEASGVQIGAYADYITTENEIVEVKVGISYTSIAQARLNLDTEIPHWKFSSVHKDARIIWGKALDKIEIEMATGNGKSFNNEKRITFYTALYHSLLFPATFGDVDGKYMGLDHEVHTAKDFIYRSDFSLWDTFRAEMPLLTLVNPSRSNDVINTMIAQYQQGGWLPTPQQFGNSYTNDMIGDHPVVAILDAYRKGINRFDVEKAYEAVKKNAMETPPADHRSLGRRGLQYYLKYGYIPYDKERESVSKTLEYAFNDWCVGMLARELGKTDDYDLFLKRASNYKNVMDLTTGFARPKNSNGEWLEPFDPKFIGHGKDRHYTEANAWQYTLFVPHDINGVINQAGGRHNFIAKLDTLFTTSSEIKSGVPDVTGLIGQYAHGNEPGHHTVYLYNYAGAPWKTQEMTRKVMENLYTASPAGLCGNEDMGQMSAWYVLSAIGIYPVAPGQNSYSIGSPLFSKVTIRLDKSCNNGSVFVVEARNNSTENRYIQSATLNGKPLNKPWFDHAEIANGGRLIFMMGSKPNKNWGSEPDAAPPSMTK